MHTIQEMFSDKAAYDRQMTKEQVWASHFKGELLLNSGETTHKKVNSLPSHRHSRIKVD